MGSISSILWCKVHLFERTMFDAKRCYSVWPTKLGSTLLVHTTKSYAQFLSFTLYACAKKISVNLLAQHLLMVKLTQGIINLEKDVSNFVTSSLQWEDKSTCLGLSHFKLWREKEKFFFVNDWMPNSRNFEEKGNNLGM